MLLTILVLVQQLSDVIASSSIFSWASLMEIKISTLASQAIHIQNRNEKSYVHSSCLSQQQNRVSQKPLPLFPLAVMTVLRLHHESGVGCMGWLVRLFRGDVMDRPVCLL